MPGTRPPAATPPPPPSEVASTHGAQAPLAAEPAKPSAVPTRAPRQPQVPATIESAPATPAPRAEPPDQPPFPEGESHDTSAHRLDNEASGFKLGKGLVVRSQDGDFGLETRLRVQFRYTLEAAEGDDGELGSPTQQAQLRRARLQFKGNYWGPNNKFKAEFALSPRDVGVRDSSAGTAPGTSPLLDWYTDLTHHRDLNVRIGQYKVPFNRQRVISSGDLQLVDRSIVNGAFNVDRDLGVDLRSKDLFGLDLIKYYLGVYVGEGRNTNSASDFGMMYLARVEILPFGAFQDYAEVDFERTPTPKLSVGLGYGYLDRAPRDRGILGSAPADGGTTDINLLNADVLLKYAGLSILSEAILRNGSRNPGDGVDDMGAAIPEAPALDGYGAMLQAGYLLPQSRLEVAARVGVVRPTGDQSVLAEQDELGGGLSYYFAHHAYKLQTDYFLLRKGPDADNKLSAHEFRVQLQSAF
jgi:phosphate-selective porin OprO and OprP